MDLLGPCIDEMLDRGDVRAEPLTGEPEHGLGDRVGPIDAELRGDTGMHLTTHPGAMHVLQDFSVEALHGVPHLPRSKRGGDFGDARRDFLGGVGLDNSWPPVLTLQLGHELAEFFVPVAGAEVGIHKAQSVLLRAALLRKATDVVELRAHLAELEADGLVVLLRPFDAVAAGEGAAAMRLDDRDHAAVEELVHRPREPGRRQLFELQDALRAATETSHAAPISDESPRDVLIEHGAAVVAQLAEALDDLAGDELAIADHVEVDAGGRLEILELLELVPGQVRPPMTIRVLGLRRRASAA
jgi:hypothetical protein